MRMLSPLIVAAMLLQGCANSPATQPRAGQPTEALPEATDFSLLPYLKEMAAQSSSNHELADAARYWAAIYETDPSNLDVAAKFATSLRLAGEPRGAIALLGQILEKRPGDPQLLGERGKAYAAANEFAPALADLDTALKTAGNDWNLHSARGVILDRQGQQADAEAAYRQALALSPGNPKILNNMALNIALAGRLDEAITLLREASRHPQATVQVRQNLSLLLAMKGDVGEAEQLARADLPAAMSDNNIAFYRSLKVMP